MQLRWIWKRTKPKMKNNNMRFPLMVFHSSEMKTEQTRCQSICKVNFTRNFCSELPNSISFYRPLASVRRNVKLTKIEMKMFDVNLKLEVKLKEKDFRNETH